MKHYSVPVRGLVLLALGAAFACSNPADDKPVAEVRPAASQPTLPRAAGGTRYSLAKGSTISFVGSKVTGRHDGGFHAFRGDIHVVDGKPETAKVNIQIDTRTLWADNEKLTEHLKSKDFFDVETFPAAIFTSTGIQPSGDQFLVSGDLTLHGVTKNITFPATVTVGDEHVIAQAEFTLMRFDFDIEYPGKADDLIRDEVVVKLDLKADAPGAQGMANQ